MQLLSIFMYIFWFLVSHQQTGPSVFQKQAKLGLCHFEMWVSQTSCKNLNEKRPQKNKNIHICLGLLVSKALVSILTKNDCIALWGNQIAFMNNSIHFYCHFSAELQLSERECQLIVMDGDGKMDLDHSSGHKLRSSCSVICFWGYYSQM